MPFPISIEKSEKPRVRVPADQLGFGKYFADHMYTLEFKNRAWGNGRIRPYGPLPFEPGASVLHYGQALFEGMKAFRGKNGKVRLFRPEFHARRMVEGAERLCMPSLPPEEFLNALTKLLAIDESWVPNEPGCALYIRPTIVGTESFLGVRPSEEYLFFIINSPVGAYYSAGFAPVKIWIEQEYIRAAPGGLGAIKAGANYAASLFAANEAKKRGYSQVLWLDAIERKYIEEVGTMNVFFKINDEIITPPLNGTILGGATRDSVLHVLRGWNLRVTERALALDEVLAAQKSGSLKEVFGAGTAAVISPVGELSNDKLKISIGSGKTGELTQRLYREITGIQSGELPDHNNWIREL